MLSAIESRNTQLTKLRNNMDTVAALHRKLLGQLTAVSGDDVYVPAGRRNRPDQEQRDSSRTKPGLFTDFVAVYGSPQDTEPFGFLCPAASEGQPSEDGVVKLGLPEWFRVPRWAKGDTLAYFEALKGGTSNTYGRMYGEKMCLTAPPPAVKSLKAPLADKDKDKGKDFESSNLFEIVRDCMEDVWILPFNNMNEYSLVLEQLATTFLGIIKTLSD